jgi:hypothetical protein
MIIYEDRCFCITLQCKNCFNQQGSEFSEDDDEDSDEDSDDDDDLNTTDLVCKMLII